MNNYKKYEKYKNLMGKLEKAKKNEFYYEAIFIEYAIIEDITESLLSHAKLKTTDSNEKEYSLNIKLKKIKGSEKFNQRYIKKHISNDLIENIFNWKNKRNKLIHSLISCKYSDEEIKNIALEGYYIVKKLNNKSTLVNNYLDKSL